MNTSFRRALIATALLTGLHVSAAAGVLTQDITPAARLGTGLLAGPGFGSKSVVVPMPAQILLPQLLPPAEQLPTLLAEALVEPAAVPEPGTVATFGAGLALMLALARRRRPLAERFTTA